MPKKRALLSISMYIVTALLVPNLAIAGTFNETESSIRNANLPFLFAAFAVAWLGFFSYLFYLHQRNNHIKQELDQLKEDLAKMDK